MFKSTSTPEPSSGSAETLIGPAVHVEGDLKAVGNIQIEGSLSGTIITDKDVNIGGEAEISADIKAQNADISGTVKGKIEVRGTLTLRSTATINGDVQTGSLSIENGANLNGQIQMGNTPRAESSTQPSSSSEEQPADTE